MKREKCVIGVEKVGVGALRQVCKQRKVVALRRAVYYSYIRRTGLNGYEYASEEIWTSEWSFAVCRMSEKG